MPSEGRTLLVNTRDLLTEKEVQPLLRLRAKTLQQWRAVKKGPRFIRVGRRVFYPREEIERYLAANVVDTSDMSGEEPKA